MASLRAKAFSSVRSTSAAAVIKMALQLVQLGILARLLTPGDFGLVALAMAIIGPAQVICDLGFGTAIIQRQNLSSQEFTSIVAVQFFAALIMAVMLYLCGPLLAICFGEPRLGEVLQTSTPLLLLATAGQSVRSILERDLAFGSLALIEITAAVIGFGAAAWMASAGWGVQALVLGQISAAGIATALMWLRMRGGFFVLTRFSLMAIRPFMRFGGGVVANGLCSSLSGNADTLIGGRILDAVALGHFQVVRDLCLRVDSYVSPIISRVGLPLLAKAQGDRDRLAAMYLTSLLMTSSVITPIMVGLGLFADDVVLNLLGPGWERSATLLQILAVWGLFRSAASQSGMLVFATGRAGLALYWNVGMLFLVPVPLWLGSMMGDVGLVTSLLAIQAVVAVPNWAFLVRPCAPITLLQYFERLSRPIVCCIPGILCGLGAVHMCSGAPSAVRLSVGVVALSLGYLAACLVFNREWLIALRELCGRLASPLQPRA